ncbi:MAG: DivIVA domain-containing protein [candidate division KSB1 bacterium]|nr:DivIVA domain-containing protein [candidate division KSB1 bacterium]MDZ7303458.1 DivIVA domain-containing protein [candidate division KSB1 bacterium]MDZ7312540.1 DivIVA domain-containing protein [candidate division KSB1 bacterium]
MRLTPLDIKKQEFKRAMRGYDPEEVNTFLEMVAEEFEVLQREKNRLDDEVLKLRTQLHDYQEVERTLKQTLMNAQESVQLSRDNSKREADLLIREAELRAEKILEEAQQKLAQLKNELLVVRAQKDSFARRLRHLLESQLELIGVLELDDLGFGDNDHRDNNLPALHHDGEIVRKQAPSFRPTAQNPSRATGAGLAPRNNTATNRAETRTPEATVVAATRTAVMPAGTVTREVNKEKPGESQEGKKEPKISDHFIT